MDNRLIIVGGITFTIGGVAGFLTARKLLEQHYQELAEIEISEMSDYYQEKYGVEPEEKVSHRQLAEKYLKPELHNLVNRTQDLDEDEEEDEEEYEDEEEDLTLAEQQLRNVYEPYLIDYETFATSSDIFDKETLFYYRIDEVICTSEDTIWPNPEDILGWEWQGQLELQSTVFVRNELLQMDYEIHALPQSYYDAVKTRLETDKEKKYRQTARHKAAMDSFSSEQAGYEEELTKKKKPYVRPTKKEITEEIADELANDELYS